MGFTAFSFLSLMPLASFLDKLKDWYDKLFSPQVSIACTLIVCLVVIWVTGALFDNWFKNKKLLLAIIKTVIIGVILFSVIKATGKGGGEGETSTPDSTKIDQPDTETPEDKNDKLSPISESASTQAPPVPVERDAVNFTIICSKNGIVIDGIQESLKTKEALVVFNTLKSHLKDSECFGDVTIVFEKNLQLESFYADMEKYLRGFHNLQNNVTEIHVNQKNTNTSTGDNK